MTTFSTTALKTNTGELVNLLIRGEEIVLTRYNRPFALIKPLESQSTHRRKNFFGILKGSKLKIPKRRKFQRKIKVL